MRGFGRENIEAKMEAWEDWEVGDRNGDRPEKPSLSEREVLEFAREVMIDIGSPLSQVRRLVAEFTDRETQKKLSALTNEIDRVHAATLGVDKLVVELAIQSFESR